MELSQGGYSVYLSRVCISLATQMHKCSNFWPLRPKSSPTQPSWIKANATCTLSSTMRRYFLASFGSTNQFNKESSLPPLNFKMYIFKLSCWRTCVDSPTAAIIYCCLNNFDCWSSTFLYYYVCRDHSRQSRLLLPFDSKFILDELVDNDILLVSFKILQHIIRAGVTQEELIRLTTFHSKSIK